MTRPSLETLESRLNPSVFLDQGYIHLVADAGSLAARVTDAGGQVRVDYQEGGEDLVAFFDRADVIGVWFEGGAGNDWLQNDTALDTFAHGGSYGQDVLTGGFGANYLDGGGGFASLAGRGTFNELWASVYENVLAGSQGGVDVFHANAGSHVYYFGPGVDTLDGEAAAVYLGGVGSRRWA